MFEESPGSTEKRYRITSGGGDPRDSATEMTPPTGPVFSGRLAAARLKWCGKSAPRLWQQRRLGKPYREQDQIGTARWFFRPAVRVGRVRCAVTHIPEEWSSPRKWYRTRLTGHLTLSFFNPSVPARAPDGAWRSVGLAANLTLRNFAAVLGSRLRRGVATATSPSCALTRTKAKRACAC